MARRIHPPQVSTTVPFDTMEWGDAKQYPLAAAPTPVEHFCEYCGTTPCNCTDPNCSCRMDNPSPAAPAESQRVERAQPECVHAPVCPCMVSDSGYVYRHHTPDCPAVQPVEDHDPALDDLDDPASIYIADRSKIGEKAAAQPVDPLRQIIELVDPQLDELVPYCRPAQPVEEPRDWWPEDSTGKKLRPCGSPLQFVGDAEPRTRCTWMPGHSGDHSDGKSFWTAAPVEGVERVTDDRPAETIPLVTIEDYRKYYRYTHLEVHGLRTRIEVLEAALRMHQEHHKRNWDTQETCHICNVTRAALAAPSGETRK